MRKLVAIVLCGILLTGCVNVNTCCQTQVACGIDTVGVPYNGSGQYSQYDENDGGGQWNQWDGGDNRDHPEFICVPESDDDG